MLMSQQSTVDTVITLYSIRRRYWSLLFLIAIGCSTNNRSIDATYNITLTATASTMAAGDNNNNAVSKTQSRQIPIVLPGHTRPLAELQFLYVPTEQRTFLISACHDAKPMVRDGATGDWIGTFTGHKGAVWSCRMDQSGSLAATASGDFSVRVWDGITGESLYQFPHKHIVKTCDFSPNSRYLATGGHEGILRIFDLTTPKKAPMEIAQDPSKKIMISKINWLSDTVLLAGCGDGVVRFWDISAANVPKAPTHTIKTGDGAEIRDMEVNSIKQILTIGSGWKVSFFNLQDHSLIHVHKMPFHFKDEGGASLHPSGTKFVAGGSDLWVRVFDFETGEELESLKGHHGPIRCLRYAPDGKTYASGSEDGTIRLWKTEPEV